MLVFPRQLSAKRFPERLLAKILLLLLMGCCSLRGQGELRLGNLKVSDNDPLLIGGRHVFHYVLPKDHPKVDSGILLVLTERRYKPGVSQNMIPRVNLVLGDRMPAAHEARTCRFDRYQSYHTIGQGFVEPFMKTWFHQPFGPGLSLRTDKPKAQRFPFFLFTTSGNRSYRTALITRYNRSQTGEETPIKIKIGFDSQQEEAVITVVDFGEDGLEPQRLHWKLIPPPASP